MLTDLLAAGPDSRPAPLLDVLLRLRWWFLGTLAALVYVAGLPHLTGDNDWQFFTFGADTLFGGHPAFVRSDFQAAATGRSGFHLYGDYAFLQIGPPALALAELLSWGPRDGLYLAGAVIQGLGLGTIALLERSFPASRGRDLTVLVGGGLATVVWIGITQSHHLDDALALCLLAGAVLALRRGNPVLVGLATGLSAASKPWALPFLALVLALVHRRDRLRAAGAAALVLALTWGPFVLVEPQTLRLGQVQLPFSPASALAGMGAHGVQDPQTLRLLQLAGGLVLALVLVRCRGWQLAPLLAVAWRLLLDPFPYQYYTAPLIVAALVADLHRRTLPVLTTWVALAWVVVAVVSPQTAAATRALTYGGLVLAVPALLLLDARRGRPARAPGLAAGTRTSPPLEVIGADA